MSFIMAGTAIVSAGLGIGKAISGAKQKRAAEAERKQAEAEMQDLKNQYAGLDISNPYLNMENVYEDMTVNKQEAEFEKQMAEQNQANILDQMRQGAGGSGIAALAQTLAQQGQLQAQKAAVSIGQQEEDIQKAMLDEQKRIQGLEIGGEIQKRADEKDRIGTFMDFAATDAEAAAQKEIAGRQQMMSGITDTVGAVAGGVGGIAGAKMEGMPLGKDFWSKDLVGDTGLTQLQLFQQAQAQKNQ